MPKYEVSTVDSKKLEYGLGVIHAEFSSYSGLGLEDGHIPTLDSTVGFLY